MSGWATTKRFCSLPLTLLLSACRWTRLVNSVKKETKKIRVSEKRQSQQAAYFDIVNIGKFFRRFSRIPADPTRISVKLLGSVAQEICIRRSPSGESVSPSSSEHEINLPIGNSSIRKSDSNCLEKNVSDFISRFYESVVGILPQVVANVQRDKCDKSLSFQFQKLLFMFG